MESSKLVKSLFVGGLLAVALSGSGCNTLVKTGLVGKEEAETDRKLFNSSHETSLAAGLDYFKKDFLYPILLGLPNALARGKY